MRIEQTRYTQSELDQLTPNPTCNEDRHLKSLGLKAQNQCECATTGKRSLSWLFWIPFISGGSKNSLLDRNNLELSHEHIFFSGSGDNIGWGEKGFFSEAEGTLGYQMNHECYNGSTIRKVISSMHDWTRYGFLKSNCQDFVDKIRILYRDSVSEQTKKRQGFSPAASAKDLSY